MFYLYGLSISQISTYRWWVWNITSAIGGGSLYMNQKVCKFSLPSAGCLQVNFVLFCNILFQIQFKAFRFHLIQFIRSGDTPNIKILSNFRHVSMYKTICSEDMGWKWMQNWCWLEKLPRVASHCFYNRYTEDITKHKYIVQIE